MPINTMNTRFPAVCALFVALLFQSPAADLSVSTNGIYLAIIGVRNGSTVSNGAVRFDDRLVWMPFADSGNIRLSYPDPKYGVRIRMTGPDGKDVVKSALGTNFGSKFEQLHDYRDGTLGGIEAWGPYKDNPDLGGGRLLPSPRELFQMEQPGIYKMEIEMQMFRQSPSTNVEVWRTNLIRFAPVEIEIERPPKDSVEKH